MVDPLLPHITLLSTHGLLMCCVWVTLCCWLSLKIAIENPIWFQWIVFTVTFWKMWLTLVASQHVTHRWPSSHLGQCWPGVDWLWSGWWPSSLLILCYLQDFQLWCDLREFEQRMGCRYLTHPGDEERWSCYARERGLNFLSQPLPEPPDLTFDLGCGGERSSR